MNEFEWFITVSTAAILAGLGLFAYAVKKIVDGLAPKFNLIWNQPPSLCAQHVIDEVKQRLDNMISCTEDGYPVSVDALIKTRDLLP